MKKLIVPFIILSIAIQSVKMGVQQNGSTITIGPLQNGAVVTIGYVNGGPPTYNVSCNTLNAQSPPNPAPFSGLFGANTLIMTPEPGNANNCLNNPILRVTDFNTASGGNMQVPGGGSGDENSFEHLSRTFSIEKSTGTPYVYAFNTSTMQATLMYSGSGLYIPHGGNYSYTQDYTYYSMANAAGTGYGTILQQSIFNPSCLPTCTPPTPSTVFDYASSSACLSGFPTITWSDQGDVSKDDNSFGNAFSTAGGQGTGIYVAAYNRTKGCILLNTSNGLITADPGWGIPGNSGYWCGVGPCLDNVYTVHNMKMRKNGDMMIASQTCTAGAGHSCNTPLAPYIWTLTTNPLNIQSACTSGCGGHWTNGYDVWVNMVNSPLGQYYERNIPNTGSPSAIISHFPTGYGSGMSFNDQHIGWGNVNITETTPWVATTNNGNFDPPYTFGWNDEVIGVFPTTGIVKRFAHTYMRAGNNAGVNFNAIFSIGSVSSDGRFYMWSSVMNDQLGSGAGQYPCIPGGGDWQATHTYAANSWISPKSNTANAGNYSYTTTIGGVSSNTEPTTFNQTFGGTTVDSTVTWTNANTAAQPQPDCRTDIFIVELL